MRYSGQDSSGRSSILMLAIGVVVIAIIAILIYVLIL